MERLTAWALEQKVHLFEAMQRAAEVETLPKGSAEKLGEFVALIERYRKAFNRSGAGAGAKRSSGQGEATSNAGNLSHLTRELLAEIQFIDSARASAPSLAAGDRKAKAVAHVIQSLEVYEKREGKKASLLTYLNRLSLDTKSDEEEPHHQAGRVTLMTLHGAKGLEWKLVFMVGVEEDLLPHSGMQGELPNPEEERRLCYVGMTRARDRLVMTRAATRIKRGKELPRTPSRFLADIPEQLCDVVELAAIPVGPPTVKEQSFFSALRDRLKSEKEPAATTGSGLDSQSTDR
jgi:DNA helicase-2/ATP-dependent DNA helicase PcrA